MARVRGRRAVQASLDVAVWFVAVAAAAVLRSDFRPSKVPWVPVLLVAGIAALLQRLVGALPGASAALLRGLKAEATGLGLRVHVLPTAADLPDGRVWVFSVRDINEEDDRGRRRRCDGDPPERTVRKRARKPRLGTSLPHRADRRRWAGDCHAPGCDLLLHGPPRGRAAGLAGGHDRRRRAGSGPRHGRVGANRRRRGVPRQAVGAEQRNPVHRPQSR